MNVGCKLVKTNSASGKGPGACEWFYLLGVECGKLDGELDSKIGKARKVCDHLYKTVFSMKEAS